MKKVIKDKQNKYIQKFTRFSSSSKLNQGTPEQVLIKLMHQFSLLVNIRNLSLEFIGVCQRVKTSRTNREDTYIHKILSVKSTEGNYQDTWIHISQKAFRKLQV
jgi:hypothetical protein